MKTRSFILVCCIVMAISICFLIAVCILSKQTPQLDWQMNGSLINPNGNFVESVPITIQGDLTLGDQGPDKGDLTITMPETFRYMMTQPEGGYSFEHRKYDGLPYAIFHGYSYDRQSNDSVISSFAIDPVKEYAIFQWDDGSGRFLVASQDPNVSATEILDHFKDFIELYGYDSK